MPTIVNIGYQTYLLKNDAQIAALMKAMIGAVALDKKFMEGGNDVYWPEKHQRSFSHEVIRADQIFAEEPSEEEIMVWQARRKIHGGKNIKRIGL